MRSYTIQSSLISCAKKHSFFLIFSLLCCLATSLLSLILGKDLSWDVANYHYYNPYAFLHQRHTIDFWPPSFIHMYFTPTADFFSYFLIHYFSPVTTQILMGMLHGINIILIYQISLLFLAKKAYARGIAIFLASIGILSAVVIYNIGAFENDNSLSILILGFVYLQLRSLDTTMPKSHLLKAMSGLMLGMAVGMKLTNGVFLVGALATQLLLPQPKTRRMGETLKLGFFIAMGIFISSGYWLLFLWQKYHNPFFPFLNGIFHSPDYPPQNFSYNEYVPRTLWQIFTFPFYFSWQGTVSEPPFRDLRFAIVYILFLFAGVYYAWQKITEKVTTTPLVEWWLFSFIIFSYIPWVYYFSIVRYFAPVAMLIPLVIYLLVKKLFTHQHSLLLLACIFYSLLFTLSPAKIARAPWYKADYFAVQLPLSLNTTETALVLLPYSAYALSNVPKPQTYLIPFFPAHWQFIGIPFFNEREVRWDEKTQVKVLLAKNKMKHIYALSSRETIPFLYQGIKNLGLYPTGPCKNIISQRASISGSETLLCPLRSE